MRVFLERYHSAAVTISVRRERARLRLAHRLIKRKGG